MFSHYFLLITLLYMPQIISTFLTFICEKQFYAYINDAFSLCCVDKKDEKYYILDEKENSIMFILEIES